MRTIAIVVLCLGLAGPAHAEFDFLATPALQSADGVEEVLPERELNGARDPVQVGDELYVPLTDDQQELPTMATPGVEGPGGVGPAPKEITDGVPAQ